MIEKNIDDINKEFLISNNKKTLKIIIDNLDFYFQFHYKKESNNLMVFSNGAIDTNIRKPPVFMRSSWSDDINANCLFIDDRTIHNSDLKIGDRKRTRLNSSHVSISYAVFCVKKKLWQRLGARSEE